MVLTRELTFNIDGNVSSVGLPVNGTRVRLYDYWQGSGCLIKHFLCEQTTTNRGAFSFNVRKGIYALEFLPNENTRYARQSIEAVKVTKNKAINVSLKAGSILSGIVRNSDGCIVTNAELLVFGIETGGLKTSQLIDEHGMFNITLPQGKYYLALKYQPKEQEKNEKNRNVPFICPLFETVEVTKDCRHDIVMPPRISFKAKITDPNGHPLYGIKAIVSRADKVENAFSRDICFDVSTNTRLDGVFECLIQPGKYNIRLVPPEELQLAEKTISATITDAGELRTFMLEAGHCLKGRVLHKGKPVRDARVNIVGPTHNSMLLTNEDGEYSFSVPQGTYDLIVAAQPDSLGKVTEMELAPTRTKITLTEDTEFDFQMEEGYLVTGVLQDASKEACAGIQVSIYSTINGEFGPKATSRRPLWVGITGDDGSYELRLTPDRYWLVLNNQAASGQYLDVSPGKQTTNLTISNICLLNLEILTEYDEPVPNCQVCTMPLGTQKSEETSVQNTAEIFMPDFSSADGRCTLALPQGTYTIYLVPPADSPFKPRQIDQLAINADLNRRVRLEQRLG